MNYYQSDPEAHPFKAPLDSSKHKPRIQWVHPRYIDLSEEQANERRLAAITSPDVIDAVEKLSKIIGPDVAGKYFGKFFDNLNREELTPGHYETK